jgi:hypothetical protein
MSILATLRRVSDATLADLPTQRSGVPDVLGREGLPEESLGKAWEAIHFLLTGTNAEGAPPLNFLVAGGRELGASPAGVVVRGFTSAEVGEIWRAIRPTSLDVLLARYDRERGAMDQRDMVLTPPDYFAQRYEHLREFLAAGVAENQALIVSFA